MSNYVIYGDTDSSYIGIGSYLDFIYPDWKKIEEDKKIKIILEVCSLLQNYVNDRVFEEIQLKDYNSREENFKIKFKQELIARSAIFKAKKKYTYWMINEDGIEKDEIKAAGIEIVRSDTPILMKEALKDTLSVILKMGNEEKIKDNIKKWINKMSNANISDIAANISANDIEKFINTENEFKKVLNKRGNKQGSPIQIQGTKNYNDLIKYLKIDNIYSPIVEGEKIKVVYLKSNKFNMKIMSFLDWPKEFDNHIHPDKETMINKYYLRKLQMILEPMKKEYLINQNEDIDEFF